MTKIGKARVSTQEQNLELQIDALKKAGCQKIFTSKVSADTKKDIEELDTCLDYLREGDVLVVWRLDRLGRSLKNLIEIVESLKKRNIGFKSLQENIDTTTPTGNLFFHIFGALAEYERGILSVRTKAGIESARARGRFGGRPYKLNQEQIERMVKMHADHSIDIKDIVKIFGITKRGMYKYINKYKNKELWFQKQLDP